MFEFIRLNLAAFLRKDDAVSSLEYAVLAVIILGAILFLTTSDGGIQKLFENMSDKIAQVNDNLGGTGGGTGGGTNP